MAVLQKEELMTQLKGIIGDSSSDETLKFIEDVTDTYDDLVSKSNGETNWEEKYNELQEEYKQNDETWRTKYRERFFSSEQTEEQEHDLLGGNGGEQSPKETPKTFEELFEN